MRNIILSRQTLLIIVLAGLSLSSSLLLFFDPNFSIFGGSAVLVENLVVFQDKNETRTSLPMRLTIPKINVDSAIEHVGLAPDGSMDVPTNRDDTAWFKLGPVPGEDGSAVIAGHYGIKDGKGSVFDNLYKLRKGDKIQVTDSKGTIVTFVVRESRRFDAEADTVNVFGSEDAKSHLNLVTCEGSWDKKTQQYPIRLVVFTDKE